MNLFHEEEFPPLVVDEASADMGVSVDVVPLRVLDAEDAAGGGVACPWLYRRRQ